MPKAKSKAQARLFGAIAGGSKKSSMTKSEAKKRLEGIHYRDLPEKLKKRKNK